MINIGQWGAPPPTAEAVLPVRWRTPAPPTPATSPASCGVQPPALPWRVPPACGGEALAEPLPGRAGPLPLLQGNVTSAKSEFHESKASSRQQKQETSQKDLIYTEKVAKPTPYLPPLALSARQTKRQCETLVWRQITETAFRCLAVLHRWVVSHPRPWPFAVVTHTLHPSTSKAIARVLCILMLPDPPRSLALLEIRRLLAINPLQASTISSNP